MSSKVPGDRNITPGIRRIQLKTSLKGKNVKKRGYQSSSSDAETNCEDIFEISDEEIEKPRKKAIKTDYSPNSSEAETKSEDIIEISEDEIATPKKKKPKTFSLSYSDTKSESNDQNNQISPTTKHKKLIKTRKTPQKKNTEDSLKHEKKASKSCKPLTDENLNFKQDQTPVKNSLNSFSSKKESKIVDNACTKEGGIRKNNHSDSGSSLLSTDTLASQPRMFRRKINYRKDQPKRKIISSSSSSDDDDNNTRSLSGEKKGASLCSKSLGASKETQSSLPVIYKNENKDSNHNMENESDGTLSSEDDGIFLTQTNTAAGSKDSANGTRSLDRNSTESGTKSTTGMKSSTSGMKSTTGMKSSTSGMKSTTGMKSSTSGMKSTTGMKSSTSGMKATTSGMKSRVNSEMDATTTDDSDATIEGSPPQLESMNDDTQIPELTLNFMSSDEDEDTMEHVVTLSPPVLTPHRSSIEGRTETCKKGENTEDSDECSTPLLPELTCKADEDPYEFKSQTQSDLPTLRKKAGKKPLGTASTRLRLEHQEESEDSDNIPILSIISRKLKNCDVRSGEKLPSNNEETKTCMKKEISDSTEEYWTGSVAAKQEPVINLGYTQEVIMVEDSDDDDDDGDDLLQRFSVKGLNMSSDEEESQDVDDDEVDLRDFFDILDPEFKELEEEDRITAEISGEENKDLENVASKNMSLDDGFDGDTQLYDADTQIATDLNDEFDVATQIKREKIFDDDIISITDDSDEDDDSYAYGTLTQIDTTLQYDDCDDDDADEKDDDFYGAETQVDGKDVTEEKICYGAETQAQVDGENGNGDLSSVGHIRLRKSKSKHRTEYKVNREDELYDAATQIQMNIEDSDDSDEFYDAQTQADTHEESNELDVIHTKSNSSDKFVTKDDLIEEVDMYNEQTQVDDVHSNMDNMYNANTQTSKQADQSIKATRTDTKKDAVYNMATQVDVIELSNDDESDNELYDYCTQLDAVAAGKDGSISKKKEQYKEGNTSKSDTEDARKSKSTTPVKIRSLYYKDTSTDADAVKEISFTAGNLEHFKEKNNSVYDRVAVYLNLDSDEDDEDAVTIDDEDDVYSMATQIDKTDHSIQHDISHRKTTKEVVVEDGTAADNDDVYHTATQVHSDNKKHIKTFSHINDEDDTADDVYGAATQVHIDHKTPTKDSSDMDAGDDKADDDVYGAATQVDALPSLQNIDQMDDDDDDDLFMAATQVDKGKPIVQCNDVKKMRKDICDIDDDDAYGAATQVDPYAAQTQVSSIHYDGIDDSSDEDNADVVMVPTDNDKTTTSEEEDIDWYNFDTQVDRMDEDETTDSDNILCLRKPSTSSRGKEVAHSSHVKQNDSATVTKKTVPHSTKKNSKDSTIHAPGKLSKDTKLIAVQRKTLPTEPQPIKSSKEIKTTFQVDKISFYTKESTNLPKAKSNDSTWLSKAKSRSVAITKPVPAKSRKRRSSGSRPTEDNQDDIKKKMKALKDQLANRLTKVADPVPHAKRARVQAGVGDVSDVKMPDEEEIQKKGLPILETPVSKKKQNDGAIASVPQEQEVTSTGKRGDDRVAKVSTTNLNCNLFENLSKISTSPDKKMKSREKVSTGSAEKQSNVTLSKSNQADNSSIGTRHVIEWTDMHRLTKGDNWQKNVNLKILENLKAQKSELRKLTDSITEDDKLEVSASDAGESFHQDEAKKATCSETSSTSTSGMSKTLGQQNVEDTSKQHTTVTSSASSSTGNTSSVIIEQQNNKSVAEGGVIKIPGSKITIKRKPKQQTETVSILKKSEDTRNRSRRVRFDLPSDGDNENKDSKRKFQQEVYHDRWTMNSKPQTSREPLKTVSQVHPPRQIPQSGNLMQKPTIGTSKDNKGLETGGLMNITPTEFFTLDHFLKMLLKWNPVWFDEQEKIGEPPPQIAEGSTLFPLIEVYKSYSDYVNIFTPHILYETWEIACSEWKKQKSSNTNKTYHIHLDSSEVSPDKQLIMSTWYQVTTKALFDRGCCVKEGDLVITELLVNNTKNGIVSYPTLGYVEKVQLHCRENIINRIMQAMPPLRNEAHSSFPGQDIVILCIKLKGKFRKMMLHNAEPSKMKLVVSLTSIIRQFVALTNLPNNILWRHLLEPGKPGVYDEKQLMTNTMRQQLKEYNDSQQKAIVTAAKVAGQSPTLPRVCLLQGPPGTGKSHTIIGIINKIVKDSRGRGRICLCAPSNAAIDELVRRLIIHKRQQAKKNDEILPRFVRVGKLESMDKDVKKYSLIELAKRNNETEIYLKQQSQIPASSRDELQNLTKKIASLQKQLEANRREKDENRINRTKNDLHKLVTKKNDMTQQFSKMHKNITLSYDEKNRIMKNILWKANIICGTLNSLGSASVMGLLGGVHEGQRFSFNCLIIDEASQATELDCLIPLQYTTSKLIMVGDPEQLPPTVLSKKATDMYFGQSLFERLFGYFRYKETSPVLMLDTQYRMNPEIAMFPSKYVYEGKLKSDHSVVVKSQHFPLKPYLLFDVEGGQETADSGAISNRKEADFIIALCRYILRTTEIPQKTIGIISPYQSQKSLLVSLLCQYKMTEIEVNTVDGFQGREKHVIIFSCVRAKSSTGSIGFLSDRRRINVAITRAKSALYIVGHLQSLQQRKGDWQSLINDARSRHVVEFIGMKDNIHEIVRKCTKPNPG